MSAAENAMVDPQPVDLLLGQCSQSERDALRQRIASDPLLALELADTVTLVEQLRQLRVEPSPRHATKLAHVMQRAQRRLAKRRVIPWPGLLISAAAALATFAVLWQSDPFGRRALQSHDSGLGALAIGAPAIGAPAIGAPAMAGSSRASRNGASSPAPTTIRSDNEVAWESTVELVRRRLGMEQSPRLQEAFEAGLQVRDDPLRQWLDPRNSLVLMRLDHELRANADVRRKALHSRGGLAAADGRIQQLADGIATQLRAQLAADAPECDVVGVALAVRAVLAAGPGSDVREQAIAVGGAWLAQQLPELHSHNLVAALAALVEVTAISDHQVEATVQHGQRLLDSVLCADDEVWSRRRPELLMGGVAASSLGDAGRLLALLPGLGLDAARCVLVRQLVLGQLRERCDRGHGEPDVLAALLYGGADLLTEAERSDTELQLQRWVPANLVPDFVTVQQLAWSITPGRHGFTRLQGQLRRLALLPAPVDLAGRAAFSLCLATNYAAFVDDDLRQFATGE